MKIFYALLWKFWQPQRMKGFPCYEKITWCIVYFNKTKWRPSRAMSNSSSTILARASVLLFFNFELFRLFRREINVPTRPARISFLLTTCKFVCMQFPSFSVKPRAPNQKYLKFCSTNLLIKPTGNSGHILCS